MFYESLKLASIKGNDHNCENWEQPASGFYEIAATVNWSHTCWRAVCFKDSTNSYSMSTTFKMSNTVLYKLSVTDSLSVIIPTNGSSHNVTIITQVILNRIILLVQNKND